MTVLTLKRKVSVPFPSLVTGTGGIKVVKSNGLWTISPDFAALGAISASGVGDPSQKQIWIWDPIADQYNVLTLAGLGDALYKLTSTSSLAIGTGAKVFATQANKDIGVGSWVLATSNASPNVNYMLGQVTAYDAAGNLTVNMTYSGGTGTYIDWTIRTSSPPGSAGKSAGYSFAWLTSTANSDPGAGNIKANNATFGAITSIYISETDADGNALAAEIAASLSSTSATKGRLKIHDPLVPTNLMTFAVTALTDNGAWDTLTVTPIANGGTFMAAEGLRVSFSATGDKGDAGIAGTNGLHAGVSYNFATSTVMADPASGNLRLNNATLSSVTALAISANSADSGNPSLSAWINTFDDSTTTGHRGLVIIRKVSAPQNFAIYDVTAALTDNTTWLQLTVAHIVSNGVLNAADAIAISFVRTGDKGAAGAGSGDLISTNNLSDVANRQTSRDNLSLHGADIASAATINLDTATGYVVDITGTTGITAVTLADGKNRIVRFTGALTLTNGASLVLPGGANITTVAGDYACFFGYAAGVVRCMYSPVTTAGMRSLAAAAGSATTVSAAGLATGGGDLSANRTITVTAAVQADMEAASSTTTAVTPAVVKNHPGVAKAWAYYTEITTTALLASYNIASVTDVGTGDTTLNFTTSFSSANFAAVGIAGTPGTTLGFSNVRGQAAGNVEIGTYNTSSTATDLSSCHVACFGDQ